MDKIKKVIIFLSIAYVISITTIVHLGWIYYHFVTPIIAGWTIVLLIPLDIFIIWSLKNAK